LLIVLLVLLIILTFTKVSYLFKPVWQFFGVVGLPVIMAGVFFFFFNSFFFFFFKKQNSPVFCIFGLFFFIFSLPLLGGVVFFSLIFLESFCFFYYFFYSPLSFFSDKKISIFWGGIRPFFFIFPPLPTLLSTFSYPRRRVLR
ncbi:hypothetical protein AACB32_00005, partial [Enterococcus faecalis]